MSVILDNTIVFHGAIGTAVISEYNGTYTVGFQWFTDEESTTFYSGSSLSEAYVAYKTTKEMVR